jgi:predicted anti-sigma-YlaC factor YlaD
MNEHLDEEAELYALGVLGPTDATRIEAHVAQCAVCATRLGEAERVVAELATAVPPVEQRLRALPSRRGTMQRWYAVAAVFVLMAGVSLGSLLDVRTLADRVSSDDTILSTIATSHFSHAEFTAVGAGAPVAKVLYARKGEWVYIIVDGAVPGCTAFATHAGVRVELGDVMLHGKTSTLFVRNPGPVERIDLVRNGALMETVRPLFETD